MATPQHVPDYGNNTVFYIIKSTTTCRFPICTKEGVGECTQKLCVYRFCNTHVQHEHLKCRYEGCTTLAVNYTVMAGILSCEDHFRAGNAISYAKL